MTKLVILSDSHNSPEAVRRVFQAEPDMTAAVFLGDGLRDLDRVAPEFSWLRIYAVAGNCDFNALEPYDGLAAFDGVLLFYTHGHNYGVKYDLDTLAEAARARGADVALFGHTHEACKEKRDGVLLFNPGSCGRSYGSDDTYGVMILANGQILSAEHKPVPKG
jgi:putative phosphoesterase